MKNDKNMEQFMCDFFTTSDYVEVNAQFLQDKLRNLIQNERLLSSQMLDYKMKYERAMFRVDALVLDCLAQQLRSDVVYRINKRG